MTAPLTGSGAQKKIWLDKSKKSLKHSYIKPKVKCLMKIRTIACTIFVFAALVTGGPLLAQPASSVQNEDPAVIPASEKLVIVWTSGDRDVALKMVFMYTLNAKNRGWWEDITLVVWGPSAKLLTEDQELQEYMGRIIEAGVSVRACKGCADQYGVSDKLEKLGITVLYIGKELTNYIKEGREVLTF